MQQYIHIHGIEVRTLGDYMFIWHILLVIISFLLLTVIMVTVYVKLLKDRRLRYMLYLLIIPIALGITGKLLLTHGKNLTQEDFDYRLANGLDTHAFSIDAGFTFNLWGISAWIAIIPIALLILVLLLIKLARSVIK